MDENKVMPVEQEADEQSSAEVVTATETTSEKKVKAYTSLDEVAKEYAKALEVSSRKWDHEATECVVNSIRTLMTINRAQEYDSAIRVNGANERISDYESLGIFDSFIAPKKVVAIDSEYAIDMLKRNWFTMSTGRVLDPAEFAVAQTKIANMLRISRNVSVVKREQKLLADVVMSSVKGDKVISLNQERLVPLNVDMLEGSAYAFALKRWAVQKANKLTNKAE